MTTPEQHPEDRPASETGFSAGSSAAGPSGGEESSSHIPEEELAAGERPPGLFEMLGRRIDEIPHVQMAESMIFSAQEGIQSATQRVEESQQAFRQKVDDIRHATPADVVTATLNYVSRHPGQGVLAAAALGFMLGRALKR